MIIKNKITNETREIEYWEFRKEFANDLQASFECFRQTELADKFLNKPDDNMLESNFYFQLQWNFNNHGTSAWYIDKM